MDDVRGLWDLWEEKEKIKKHPSLNFMTHLLGKTKWQIQLKKKEKKNGKYNLLPLQVPVALDYKRDCHIHCKILQLHKITWHFFTASAKTKTRFELNFLFTLYGCLWISVKMSETRTATKTAAEQKQKQQRCSHNKNRLTQSLRREREE